MNSLSQRAFVQRYACPLIQTSSVGLRLPQSSGAQKTISNQLLLCLRMSTIFCSINCGLLSPYIPVLARKPPTFAPRATSQKFLATAKQSAAAWVTVPPFSKLARITWPNTLSPKGKSISFSKVASGAISTGMRPTSFRSTRLVSWTRTNSPDQGVEPGLKRRMDAFAFPPGL